MISNERSMRHMAMVPKGFLRYQVLRLLNQRPMSGSEITGEIAKKTDGYWKPSPGSMYPLLAWLQEKGYIKEIPEQVVESKRYAITEKGITFLEEHERRFEELRKQFKHFGPGPGFMGPMWFEFYPEKAKELQKATKDLALSIFELRDGLKRQYSVKIADEAKEIMEEATEKIEGITKKLKEGVAD